MLQQIVKMRNDYTVFNQYFINSEEDARIMFNICLGDCVSEQLRLLVEGNHRF